MNEQIEKTFQTPEQEMLEGNDSTGKEKADATNLQHDPVNLSENVSETDKVSEDEDTSNKEKKACCASDTSRNDGKKEPDWEEKYAVLNDSHLRLVAEFDNFRKRTIREKADLIKTGSAAVLTNLLPVVDDFERALNTLQTTEELSSALDGVKLIYDKFFNYLSQQGVKVIKAIDQPFDTELFEAVATFPVAEEVKKGKVIDCIQTGYTLYDRVLRHAKVVVGE